MLLNITQQYDDFFIESLVKKKNKIDIIIKEK